MEQPGVKYFFEIPVYRCSYEKYEAEMEQEKEKVLRYFMRFPDISREIAETLYMKHPQRKDRISWRFNQIIGYLRLYVETGKDAIKVEYWRIEHKRIPRIPANKKFAWQGWNINEMWITDDMTSSEIYEELLTMLAELGKRSRFKQRHIDLGSLSAVGPHIDWRAVVNS